MVSKPIENMTSTINLITDNREANETYEIVN